MVLDLWRYYGATFDEARRQDCMDLMTGAYRVREAGATAAVPRLAQQDV